MTVMTYNYNGQALLWLYVKNYLYTTYLAIVHQLEEVSETSSRFFFNIVRTFLTGNAVRQ